MVAEAVFISPVGPARGDDVWRSSQANPCGSSTR